ncbi:hypothetical protein Shal_3436 [Shewanella halifaxensis HAW-EB4]|uniref:Uncharacterized protein n=1 Tax=Shewanella halifaxensis (strain HAW-EB4) TaxID=458817 RepID=B0TSM8_SHEHH|nr:hypothetical protein [Shewanella halifaxensis]ABZ77982.1 hypothetical protein Shal_3436 [Shewanella halifaxensis HAW-EB4]
MNKAMNKFRQVNKQQIATVAVLMLLVVAVQVSTDRAGDWIFIGLNLIEMGSGTQSNLTDFSDVAADVTLGDTELVLQIVTRTLECFITWLTQ